MGVFGESGCGKSLLLRALADLDPHGGEVSLDQVDAQQMSAPAWRTLVALLVADSQWWFDTVGEHFSVLNSGDLARLGFREDVGHWQVSRLSSGERQRLALLRLLQNQPRVLLLDEPTANLDAQNTALFEQFIDDYRMQHDACVVWVSHDREQLARVAQNTYELKQGNLQEASCSSR